MIMKLLICCICLAPALAMATGIGTTTEEFTVEHAGTMNLLFGVSMVGLGFFLVRILNQNDKQHTAMMTDAKDDRERFEKVNDKQWREISKLSREFGQLKGEHEGLKYSHFRVDDVDGTNDH